MKDRGINFSKKSCGRKPIESRKKKIKFDITVAKRTKLLLLFLPIVLMASGGYDHGTSAGKGNWDISLTWNPFNYFKQGQSYVVLGYGLTKRLDIHGYYSATHNGGNNYYGGLSYQFLNTRFLDLSTAVGIRAYTHNDDLHLFMPQLLYTLRLSEKLSVGGSFVDIRYQNLDTRKGIAEDVFLMVNIYENNKFKIDITAGGFNPVLWEPKSGDWYPTYSIDIKIKK
jgi:hypothetical protein